MTGSWDSNRHAFLLGLNDQFIGGGGSNAIGSSSDRHGALPRAAAGLGGQSTTNVVPSTLTVDTPGNPLDDPNDAIPQAIDSGITFAGPEGFNVSGPIGDNANMTARDGVDLYRVELDARDTITIDIGAAPGKLFSLGPYLEITAPSSDTDYVGVSSFANFGRHHFLKGCGFSVGDNENENSVFATIEGSAGKDVLIGSSNDDLILGLAGNDVLRGRGGNDGLDGGTGNDKILGDTGDDELFGGDGRDRLFGGVGDDLLRGEAGNDFLSGGSGNDLLVGGPIQPTIGLNFTGSTSLNTALIPPDTMGAVGLDHIVELINGRYSVYDKATGAQIETSTHNQFWLDSSVATVGGAFDPRVLFDPFSERWIAAASDFDSFLIAASNSSDPTQGWTGFEIAKPPSLPLVDFPSLGFDADVVVVNAGTENLIIPKENLFNGSIADASIVAADFDVSRGKLQPVVDYDNTGLPYPLYSFNLETKNSIQLTTVDNTATSPVVEVEVPDSIIFEDTFSAPPDAEQPGPKRNLDTGDDRFSSNLVLEDGTVWGVHAVEADGRAALHWFRIDEATNLLLEDGLIADDELDFYYGSIAVNEFGDVVIGFNGSSEAQFASSYAVVGQTGLDDVTTFGEPILLKAGVADYDKGGFNNRWGDYSATVVDPEDPFIFWTFQEFVPSEDVWATQITQIDLLGGDGSDDDKLFGGPGDDVIAGGAGRDLLIGGLGNDRLFGGNDKDRLIGGPGDDELRGGLGDDNLDGGPGQDFLSGGGDNDRIFGRGGNDELSGGLGDDDLDGGPGQDFLSGGGDNDRILGRGGDDVLSGGDGQDYLAGGSGDDELRADFGDDTAFGGPGNDRLIGSNGNDLLDGESGNDTLFGDAGEDQLVGGPGNDELDGGFGDDEFLGGRGADTFVFNVAANLGTETILDFDGSEDLLRFPQLADENAPGLADDLDAITTVTDNGVGQAVIVVFNAGTTLEFQGVGTGAIDSVAGLVDDPLRQLLNMDDGFLCI